MRQTLLDFEDIVVDLERLVGLVHLVETVGQLDAHDGRLVVQVLELLGVLADRLHAHVLGLDELLLGRGEVASAQRYARRVVTQLERVLLQFAHVLFNMEMFK